MIELDYIITGIVFTSYYTLLFWTAKYQSLHSYRVVIEQYVSEMRSAIAKEDGEAFWIGYRSFQLFEESRGMQ